jgi:hypothetical protein
MNNIVEIAHMTAKAMVCLASSADVLYVMNWERA